MMTEGRIVKALSGFYYVETAVSHIIECKARGKFRKEGISPLVGDRVRITEGGGKGVLEEILPRRNSFVRPATFFPFKSLNDNSDKSLFTPLKSGASVPTFGNSPFV